MNIDNKFRLKLGIITVFIVIFMILLNNCMKSPQIYNIEHYNDTTLTERR